MPLNWQIIEGWIIEVKKLVFKKATMSLYSVIQQYQVHKIFVFIDFIATQKKKIILGENEIVKRKNIYMLNQHYYYFGLPKIRIIWAHTTKN